MGMNCLRWKVIKVHTVWWDWGWMTGVQCVHWRFEALMILLIMLRHVVDWLIWRHAHMNCDMLELSLVFPNDKEERCWLEKDRNGNVLCEIVWVNECMEHCVGHTLDCVLARCVWHDGLKHSARDIFIFDCASVLLIFWLIFCMLLIADGFIVDWEWL